MLPLTFTLALGLQCEDLKSVFQTASIVNSTLPGCCEQQESEAESFAARARLFPQSAFAEYLDTDPEARDALAYLAYETDDIAITKYYNGHNASSLVGTWSVAKTFTSLIAGIAMQQGVLGSPETIPLASCLPAHVVTANSTLADSTLSDAMNFRLGYPIGYDVLLTFMGVPLEGNEVATALTGFSLFDEALGVEAGTLSALRPHPLWPLTEKSAIPVYESFSPQLAAACMQRTINAHRGAPLDGVAGAKAFEEWVREHFFAKLGDEHSRLIFMKDGHVMVNIMLITSQFGMNAMRLLLQGGKFGGEQLLHPQYAAELLDPSKYVLEQKSPDPADSQDKIWNLVRLQTMNDGTPMYHAGGFGGIYFDAWSDADGRLHIMSSARRTVNTARFEASLKDLSNPVICYETDNTVMLQAMATQRTPVVEVVLDANPQAMIGGFAAGKLDDGHEVFSGKATQLRKEMWATLLP